MNPKMTSASLDLNNKKPLSSLDLIKQSLASKPQKDAEKDAVVKSNGSDMVQLSEAAKTLFKQSESLEKSLFEAQSTMSKLAGPEKWNRASKAGFVKLADILQKYQDVSNQLKPEKRPRPGS